MPQSNAPTRNYMRQGEQRKLLALVLLLGFAVISFQHIGNPGSFAWFNYLTNANPPQPPVNTRLHEASVPSMRLGEVIVAQAKDQEPGPAPLAPHQPVEPQRLAGVTDADLKPIRDDAPFSASEHDPFFKMLDLLNTSDPVELSKIAQRDIPFSQLYNQPEVYRGEVMRLRGVLRAAHPDLNAAPNQAGIKHYHQLWVSPIDKQKSEVFAIYSLDLPNEIPRGEGAAKATPGEIEVVGVYFKRWAYRAREGEGNLHSTPLLLAKTVTWRAFPPVEAAKAPERDFTRELSMAVVGALILVGGVLWYIGQRPKVTPHTARLMAFSTGKTSGRGRLEDLRNLEVRSDVLDALNNANSSRDQRR